MSIITVKQAVRGCMAILELQDTDSYVVSDVLKSLEWLRDNWEMVQDDAYEVENGIVQYNKDEFPPEYLDIDCGLCDNIFTPLDLSDVFKLYLFQSWEHFSGNDLYPIEGYAARYNGTPKFNDKRLSLLNHCIQVINEVV